MRPLIADRATGQVLPDQAQTGPAIAPSQVPSQARKKDPAPSRLAYRAERLWLRPAFRKFCRVGLPLVALIGGIGLWASDPENRLAVTDGLAQLQRSIEARPEFQVSVIGIEGTSPALADEVRIILGADLPVSSFDLDLDAMRDRIETLPGVAQADLRIRTGGYLAITITEREPAMVWQTRGGAVLLDATGAFVSALDDRPGTGPLPQIAGEGADLVVPEALALLQSAAELDHPVRGLVRMGERRWDLVLADDRRIQLPGQDAGRALDRLIALEAAQDILSRDVLRVDMRNPDRLSLQLSPEALAELRRMRDFQNQAQLATREDRG